jgi:hypothetical protein
MHPIKKKYLTLVRGKGSEGERPARERARRQDGCPERVSEPKFKVTGWRSGSELHPTAAQVFGMQRRKPRGDRVDAVPCSRGANVAPPARRPSTHSREDGETAVRSDDERRAALGRDEHTPGHRCERDGASGEGPKNARKRGVSKGRTTFVFRRARGAGVARLGTALSRARTAFSQRYRPRIVSHSLKPFRLSFARGSRWRRRCHRAAARAARRPPSAAMTARRARMRALRPTAVGVPRSLAPHG